MKKQHFIFVLLALMLNTVFIFAQKKVQRGKASFYHNSLHGNETSNGEVYNKNDFTAAHRTLPFGTILLVTNKTNHKSTIVRVNDRGPFVHSRVLDLSYAAAKKLGMVRFGVVQVRITPLTWLDSLQINNSAFFDGEVYDCYSNKRKLTANTLQIWQTENWKHAIYMASSLSLEMKTDVFIKVKGSPENRSYLLLISNLDDTKCNQLDSSLTKNGFKVSNYKSQLR